MVLEHISFLAETDPLFLALGKVVWCLISQKIIESGMLKSCQKPIPKDNRMIGILGQKYNASDTDRLSLLGNFQVFSIHFLYLSTNSKHASVDFKKGWGLLFAFDFKKDWALLFAFVCVHYKNRSMPSYPITVKNKLKINRKNISKCKEKWH